MDNIQENDIPEEYSNILSDIIDSENIKDYTTIVSPASAKGENYLGILFRVNIIGVNKSGEKSELNLILKIPPQLHIFREKFPLHTLFEREVLVYKLILPELCALQDKFNVPKSEQFKPAKCYRADAENLKEYLVLEDLNKMGFYMANRRESLGLKHMKLVLKSLASLHAMSFVLKKVDPDKFTELSSHTGGIFDYNDEYFHFFDLSRERAISVLDDPVCIERLKKYGEGMGDKLKFYVEPGPYSVICHGDSWNNNILFKFEEDEPVDIMLLDWQISRNCSPITDIAYLIFSSTDYDLRKEHFKDLMDHYHSCLAKSLSYMDCDVEDHFPKAVFEDHLKKILPYGLFMSFMLLPAVLGEAEDVPDMDELLKKEKLGVDDLKFENKQSSNRYNIRMNGVVRTLVELDLI